RRCVPMEGRPADDSDLIARAQRGDAAAYEEIVQRYQQIAFRTAYVVTGSAADAEDAAQEGFVKAFRALDRFRAGAELRPWLLRIVANEARNRVRSSGRRHNLELRLTEGFRPGDAAPSPEAVAAASLLIVAIALAAYPPSRDAIARWVNLHTIIQRVPNPPTPSPLPSGSTGERLHLGSPTTLEAAQQKVSWKIAVPSRLGRPD